MSGIKAALTRKFGPLPAWAWAGIAGIGVWWYRRRTASSNNPANTLPQYYPGPFGADPYGITGGAGTGIGDGSGGSTGGGGGSNPGPGTNNDNTPNPNPDAPPPQNVAPSGSPHPNSTRHNKGKTVNERKAAPKGLSRGARKASTAPLTRAAQHPRTNAVVGSSHTKRERVPRTKPSAKTRTTNPGKITKLSTNRRRTRR